MALAFGCICGIVVLLVAACSSEDSDASSCGGRVLLDVADYCISKAKDMFPTCRDDDSLSPSGCGKKEMSVAYLETAKDLISKSEEKYPKCGRSRSEETHETYSRWKLSNEDIYTTTEAGESSTSAETHQTYSWWKLPGEDIYTTTEADENSETEETTFSLWDSTLQPIDTTTAVSDSTEAPILPPHPQPRDCTDVLENGQKGSSFYSIWVSGTPHFVYCDMHTDGGGWTVIQRRGNFTSQVDFYRDWNSYKMGFGNILQEFWMGNENIHVITNQSHYEVRFDLEDENGDHRFAMYDSFWIDDESSNYTLHIDGYTGDAGDSMAYHNGHPFSTKDKMNKKCAVDRRAGWWYDWCAESNLNGMYQPGVEDRMGITWYSWHKHHSLAGSEIKIRRKKQDKV